MFYSVQPCCQIDLVHQLCDPTTAPGMVAGPVLKCNDTDDARAKVLDSEELMHYLHQRAQAAVNSRDDAEDHLRHVSSCALVCFRQASLS